MRSRGKQSGHNNVIFLSDKGAKHKAIAASEFSIPWKKSCFVRLEFRLEKITENGIVLKLAVSQTLYSMPLWSLVPLAKRHIDNQHFHSISKDLLSYYRILTLIKHMYFKAATSKMEYPRKRKVCWPMAKRAFDYSSLCFLKIYTKEIEMHDY